MNRPKPTPVVANHTSDILIDPLKLKEAARLYAEWAVHAYIKKKLEQRKEPKRE